MGGGLGGLSFLPIKKSDWSVCGSVGQSVGPSTSQSVFLWASGNNSYEVIVTSGDGTQLFVLYLKDMDLSEH